MRRLLQLKQLFIIFLFLAFSNSIFAEDVESKKWEKINYDDFYFSFFDCSSISNLSADGSFGFDLFSVNFKCVNNILLGATLFYSERDFKTSTINMALFPLNLYFNTLDLMNDKAKLTDFFYCHCYPLSFSFNKPDFSYNPYCLVGNEISIGVYDFILPGTYGIGVEYKVDKTFLDFSKENVLKNTRINLFYKFGTYTPFN